MWNAYLVVNSCIFHAEDIQLMDCTIAVVKNSLHPKIYMLSDKNQCDLSPRSWHHLQFRKC